MATLANLVKNINPPRQMTWTAYNALPTQVKNDGTQYYITDRDDAVQTAATTPALDKNGNSSNVQTELDSLNTNLDGIINGPTQVDTASLLIAPSVRGIRSDAWGGLQAKSDNATSYWHIDNNAKNFSALRVYFQTGSIRNQRGIICHGAGDTLNQINFLVGGWISNAQKRISFSIPCLNNATSIVLNKMGLKICTPQQILPYMKYGSNASSSLQLYNSSNSIIWQNSTQKYASSISSLVLTNYYQYIIVQINFTNALVTTSGGTTAIRNNTPVAVQANITIQFS